MPSSGWCKAEVVIVELIESRKSVFVHIQRLERHPHWSSDRIEDSGSGTPGSVSLALERFAKA